MSWKGSDTMTGEPDPNAALFGNDEPEESPEEAFMKETFGKNPNRTSALADIFGGELIATACEEAELPEEAKKSLIFKMTANSVLDVIVECLSPELAEEVVGCLDGYLGMCLVNKKNNVDIMGELRKAVLTIKQDADESDEDFERRLADMEDAWWSIPQPLLNGRNPNDAIIEEMKRYGLSE